MNSKPMSTIEPVSQPRIRRGRFKKGSRASTASPFDALSNRLSVLRGALQASEKNAAISKLTAKQQRKRENHLQEISQIEVTMDNMERTSDHGFSTDPKAGLAISQNCVQPSNAIPGLGQLAHGPTSGPQTLHIPPRSGPMSAAPGFWQQEQPVSGAPAFAQQWFTPMSNTPSFGQEWPSFSTHVSTQANNPTFRKPWNSFNSHSSLQLNPRFISSAATFVQPWSTLTSTTSGFDCQNPSTSYMSPRSNSAGMSSSDSQQCDSLIEQARTSHNLDKSRSSDQSTTSNTFQRPAQRMESTSTNDRGEHTIGHQRGFHNPAADIPVNETDEAGHQYHVSSGALKRSSKISKDRLAQFYAPPAPGTTITTLKRGRQREAIVPPSKASGGIPEPSARYLSRSYLPPLAAKSPQHILLVIDLNGTILHRPDRNRSAHFVERPNTQYFLKYVLDNFKIMIWSSAKPENVRKMCQQLLPSGLEQQQLVAIWGRDRIGLSPADYVKRVQCYKRLSLIWNDSNVQERHPEAPWGKCWDQYNTVLLDDSVEKARSEPHNLVQVPEFNGAQEDSNILGDLANYLTALKMQTDVSAYMRQNPFRISQREGQQIPG